MPPFGHRSRYWPHEGWAPRPLLPQGTRGRRRNVFLTAVGHNLRIVRLAELRFILLGLCRALNVTPALKWTS